MLHFAPSIAAALLAVYGVSTYGFYDIRYYYNILSLMLRNRLDAIGGGNQRTPLPLIGTSTIEFRVRLSNIDFWKHMNNSEYLRYAEHGWIQWFIDTNLDKLIIGKTAQFRPIFLSTAIHFRKELVFNQKVILQTKAVFWNETMLILSHRFIDEKTHFLHAIMYGKIIIANKRTGKRIKHFKNENEKKNNNKNVNALAISPARNGFHQFDWYNSVNDEFVDKYHCREILPQSVKSWLECLDQISIESKHGSKLLLQQPNEKTNESKNVSEKNQLQAINTSAFVAGCRHSLHLQNCKL